ncbi:hypothetical protein J2X32_003559 [Rheinheimera pacifica]|uniref:hypothetical protein n=1 Tax=Rheinheimera pacifica TaxID=173990 RepID=UPI00285644A5|nr:hypothetical protein [Rheinheimera pacifica]MDR6984904.1 hypothetical protein [Rheinheimera pacifica]
MEQLDFEKINEEKALEDSIRNLEGFNAEKNNSVRLKYLVIGCVIFIASLTVFTVLRLPIESYIVGITMALGVILIQHGAILGKSTFYAKHIIRYVDLESMRSRLNELRK